MKNKEHGGIKCNKCDSENLHGEPNLSKAVPVKEENPNNLILSAPIDILCLDCGAFNDFRIETVTIKGTIEI